MANAVPATSKSAAMPAADVISEMSKKKAGEAVPKLSPKAEDTLGLIAKPLVDGEKIVERNGAIYRERKSVNGKNTAILSSRIA